jgi:hypothetical protein
MSEWIEIIKVTGPAIAVLFYFAISFWSRLNEKDKKIDELYKMLFDQRKSILPATPTNMQSYIDFLCKQADSLKQEIEQIRQKPQ